MVMKIVTIMLVIIMMVMMMLRITVLECLVCMRFLFLYLHLFSATEHVSHGKAL